MADKPLDWEAVFFDFDGVVAASLEVKTEAFSTLFRKYTPEVADAAVAFHLANGGMSRYAKLRYCFQELVGQEISKDKILQLAAEFAELVCDRVVAAPLMAGAASALQQLQQQQIPAFIVSGTPHEEMGDIIRRKELDAFFLEVHGSPRLKTEIVTDILTRYNYKAANCLFIGDALADYEAAVNTGMSFLGIVPDVNDCIFTAEVITSPTVKLTLK